MKNMLFLLVHNCKLSHKIMSDSFKKIILILHKGLEVE